MPEFVCAPASSISVKKYGQDIFSDSPYLHGRLDDLKGRFKDLPLHQKCYHQTTKIDDIEGVLDEKRTAANDVDAFGMTALHLLACGANPNFDVFEKVLAANPEAVDVKDYMGRYPIDILFNGHLWKHFDVVKNLLKPSSSAEMLRDIFVVDYHTEADESASWNEFVENSRRRIAERVQSMLSSTAMFVGGGVS
jgi:ankyrin repeat protein